ncbi:MAG: LuxR C-terminal-related transcriptional regulator [Defluviitaleaceae bacterium]|nr:LuxR C-terminal-related transcriptional regulator [Defluviitaleaceae bacterium]
MYTIGDTMLERRGLLRTFNKLKHHRVLTVCAPAGYGKTVAVTQWLNNDARAKAMLPLDEYDNSLPSLCRRFSGALRLCQPHNNTLDEIISNSSFQSAPVELTLRAISALSVKKQAVVAIDDLHYINDSAVIRHLIGFIKRLPRNFSIILISRHDLPHEMYELWIKGQAAIVSAEHFQFTSREVADLYKVRGNHITQKQADDILQKTHGWALGINAFILSNEQLADKVYGFLDEFLQSNIWAKWDDTTREFMLRTAAARELTPSLCEALTGNQNSGMFLNDLVKKGAFITQLQVGVYRYHHLFQRFLRQMADVRGEDFINSLLAAEGYWHLSQGDFYTATKCFIECKIYDGIAECYGLLTVFAHNDFVFEKLLPIVKHPMFMNAAQKYPHLLYMMAYCELIDGRADDMAAYMDNYYARYPDIAGMGLSFAAGIFYMRLIDYRVSLSQLPVGAEAITGLDRYTPPKWSVSMHMPVMHRGMRDLSELAVGDAAENCNVLMQNAGRMLGEEGPLMCEVVKAGLLYEQGRLDMAYEYAINANTKIKKHFMTESVFCAMSILVYIMDAIKETDEAAEIIKSIENLIDENKAYHLSGNFNALTKRRKIIQGDLSAAASWLETQTFKDINLRGIYTDFALCRALIAIGRYDSAIIRLRNIYEITSEFNRPLDIIEAQILLAIAYWNRKRKYQKKALDYLEGAVSAAHPFGYTQMFLNNGAELSGMLNRLLNRTNQLTKKPHISFIRMLCLKLNENHDIEPIIAPPIKAVSYTNKQKEIMRLLCKGYSYRQISDDIGIKYTTLRSHLKLIYNKLNVTTMADAIAKINALKLLD